MDKDINLFTPIKLGNIELHNRMVMAPLTRNRAGEGNVPRDMNVKYYEQRASAGLIITEASQISPQGVGYPATPGIHSDAQIKGWSRVTDAVHKQGSRIFLQLWHVGRISHPSLQPEGRIPIAPSAIRPDGEAVTYEGMKLFETPRALKLEEIPGIIEQYRVAAQNARQAGFDGVEIHAANGYLLDQFLRDGSNKRTDAYGGSLENRVRLLMEVTRAVVDVWGGGAVGVRISPSNPFNSMSDSDPQKTFDYVAGQLNQFDLAYLHVVEIAMDGADEVPDFDFIQLRKFFKASYIANGGYTRERAESALANGGADLVAFGVLFLSNPDLPERFAKNLSLNEPDVSTFYGGSEMGYTDYPFYQ